MTDRIPTLAGFTAFIRDAMLITTAQLPANSVWIQTCYDLALEIVNLTIAQASPVLYTLAVYNLAGDNLINFAPDQAGQTFFTTSRTSFNCLGFNSGVIQSSGDEGTNQSLVVQEAAKNFTLADLQNLKTPYGRQYLSIAQQYGTQWGLS